MYYLRSRYYNPVIGRFINADTTDVLTVSPTSLAGSMVEVAAKPTDPWVWASLIGDTIDLIPVVSGCGEAMKALKIASDASDKLKTVGKTLKKWKIGDPIDALTQAGNIPTWNTIRQRYRKNVGNALKDHLDEKTLNRLKKGLAPLDDMGNSIHLHHPNGRDTLKDYFTFGPMTPKEHFEWHMKYGFKKE